MAKSPTDTTTPKKTRAPRKTNLHHFVAKLTGEDNPTLVVANTQKSALAAIVTIKAATPADLLEAGRKSWNVVDTTVKADPSEAV